MNIILELRRWGTKSKWQKGCEEVAPTCDDAATALTQAKAIMENFAPFAGNHTMATPGAYKPMADWLKRWT